MKKIVLILFLLLYTFSSCKNDDDSDNFDTSLRIQNKTLFDLKSVVSNETSFGDINSGVTTSYYEFEEIFIWPDVICEVNGVLCGWSSPIDNGGFWTATHDAGNYTIQITDINLTTRVITAEVIEE